MKIKPILNAFLGALENKKKVILKFILALICTIIIIYFIFRNIEIKAFVDVFRQISVFVIIFPFLFYLFSHFFRAVRFYLILEKAVSLKKLIHIVFINNFWNSILPMRLGELSYIYLLKKENIESTKGVFTLGTVRLFDLAAIFIFFSIALFFTTLRNYYFNIFFISFLSLLLFVLILIIFFRRIIFNFFQKTNSSLNSKILSKIIGTLEHFVILKSKLMIFNQFVLSLFVWLFALLTGYFIVHFFIDVSFFVVILGLCLVMLTYVLPIQGLMGFGTTEGAWAIVLIVFGFTKEQAIATGFAFHVLSLFYTTILGLCGYLLKDR